MTNAVPINNALRDFAEQGPARTGPGLVAEVASEMTGTIVQADQGTLDYFEHRPGRECRMLWSFSTASERQVWISGKWFNDAEGERLIDKPSFQRLAVEADVLYPANHCHYKYLHERRLLLQLFPFDSKLPGLVRAASQTWAGRIFARYLALPEEELQVIEVKPLGYKPWGHVALRYALAHQQLRLHWFCKVLHDDSGLAMFDVLRILPERFQRAGVPWDIAKPLFYLPPERMLVMEAFAEAIEVKDLLARFMEEADARRALRLLAHVAAEGLTAFQRVAVPGLPENLPQTQLKKLQKSIAAHGGSNTVLPGAAETMGKLLRGLEESAARLPPEPVRLSHGAFRHTHFLLRNDRPAIIDLDGLCMRGISADAAEFLAYLAWTRCRQASIRLALDECETAFLDGLKQQESLFSPWLAWHRSAALLKWALHSLRAPSAQCEQDTAAVLRLAEDALSGLNRSRRAGWNGERGTKSSNVEANSGGFDP
jgi:hypothetical protein